MTPRCEAFIRLRALVARLEYESRTGGPVAKREAKRRAGQAKRELGKVAQEMTEAEQDWIKCYLAEEAEG